MKVKRMYTVAEVSEHFGVTPPGVRYWIAKGLKTKTEKVIGIKPRKVIDLDDVYSFLKLTKEV
jgi:hypothetical protein